MLDIDLPERDLVQRLGLQDAFDDAWIGPPSWKDVVVVGVARQTAWRPWLAEATALLDAHDRARAERMKHARDAEQRILAYALHRLFLGRLLGIDAAAVPIDRDAHGRPIVGHGLWHTSLSHGDDAIAFAASSAGVVGVDVEHVDRAAGTVGIAEDILHPSEAEGLDMPDRNGFALSLLATWVRKEAYLKACGTGLVEAMSAFALPEGAVLPLRLPAGMPAACVLVETRQHSVLPDHMLAVCSLPGLPVRAALIEPR